MMKLGRFTIALTFFFGTFATTDSNAQGALNEVLKKMDEHKDGLQSLEANVMMTKVDSLIGTKDEVSGKTYYLPKKGKDAYVRINWTEPMEETLLVKNGEYILYRKRLSQAIRGTVSDSQKNTKTNSAMDFMNMSKKELRSNYSIQLLGNKKSGNDEYWHLKLTPKNKKGYKYAELVVDGDGMPFRAKIVEQNDDSTSVRLSRIKKNVNLSADVFNLTLPSGTKIIKG